jgi:hypothetical protein
MLVLTGGNGMIVGNLAPEGTLSINSFGIAYLT